MNRKAIWLLPVAIALTSCAGYTHGFRLPEGAEDVETIAVDMFRNRTLYMNLDSEFTLALQREIEAKTPLRIASRDEADTLITGSIEDYERVVLRGTDTDEVSRYRIIMTVNYTFERLPSDGAERREIRRAVNLKRSAEYEVRSAVTESQARARAVRRTARGLVSHLFETW